MIRPGVVVAVFSTELGLLYYGSGELCIFLRSKFHFFRRCGPGPVFFFFSKKRCMSFHATFPSVLVGIGLLVLPSGKKEIRHIFPSGCFTFNTSSYVFSSPRQCIAVKLGMILPWAPGNQSTEPTNETGTERTKRTEERTGNEAQREPQNPNGNTKAPKALTGTPRAPTGTPRAPRGQNTVSSQTVSSQIYLEAGEGVGCPL